jgi:pimeloyl-ACP methyl ester carboxylesterase
VSSIDRHEPPGRVVEVQGRKVHFIEAGTGSPTVVFESGMGANVLDWTRVFTDLPAPMHRLAHDRAGLGWSDAPSTPRTPAQIVDELEALLEAAGQEPPYVFVAHSMGSRYVRLFAARHRGAVAGLVLVDGYHESWDLAVGPEALASFIKARVQFWKVAALLGRLGIVRLLGGLTVSLFGPDYRQMPRAERRRYAEILTESRALEVASQELIHGGDSNEDLNRASLGDLPVVVIAHGVPFRDPGQEQAWQASQVEMAARSSRARLVRAEGSAHSVMIAEPELVIGAIEEVVAGIATHRT